CHYFDQLLGLDRLGNVHLETGFFGSRSVLGARIGGQRGRRQGVRAGRRADSANQLVPVTAGHADIRDQHVRSKVAEGGQRSFDRGGGRNLRLAVAKDTSQQ